MCDLGEIWVERQQSLEGCHLLLSLNLWQGMSVMGVGENCGPGSEEEREVSPRSYPGFSGPLPSLSEKNFRTRQAVK